MNATSKPLVCFFFVMIGVCAFAGTKAYVSKTGSNTAPYGTWETAANDLAVAIAAGTDEVEVGDGNFTNTVNFQMADRAVYIHSSNGPSTTTLTATGGHFQVTHANAHVAGFTLKNAGKLAAPDRHPIVISAGVVSNCVVNGTLLRNDYATIVKLSDTGKLLDCDIDGSGWTDLKAGGSDSGWALVEITGSAVVDRCRIHGWKATKSSAKNASQAHSAVRLNGDSAVLRNSLVYDNAFGNGTYKGGNYNGGGIFAANGTVENCTVCGNTAGANGGGIYVNNAKPVIRNCIVWGNTAYGEGNDIYAETLPAAKLTYTCASDIGNTTSLPLASDGEGCTNADPNLGVAASGYRLTHLSTACIDHGTATAASGVAGALDLFGNVRVMGAQVDMGCHEFFKAYVTKAGGNVSPYDSWQKAANDLAVAIAAGADEVEVGDGNYTNTVQWQLADRAVYIHSANGPSATTLTATGGHFKVTGVGALVAGFTLKDTGKLPTSDRHPIVISAGTVSNCVVNGTIVRNDYATIVALSGAGRLLDCDVDGSGWSDSKGGGSDSGWALVEITGSAIVDRCRIHGWKVTRSSSKNLAQAHSAVRLNGVSAVLRNSLVYDNAFGNSAYRGGNYNGGGIFAANGTIENCTVCGNTAGADGGGIYVTSANVVIRNCIVWGNVAHGEGSDIYGEALPAANLTYTCSGDIGNTTSLPLASAGEGCFSDDPKLKTTRDGDVGYPRGGSPCLGTGDASVIAAGAVDLLGRPRVKDGKVDMGCYEVWSIPGFVLLFR